MHVTDQVISPPTPGPAPSPSAATELGKLTERIGNDLNNLLTGVLGFAELAAARAEEPEVVREYLQQIEDAARAAAELCRAWMARFGRGIVPVAPVRVDLNEEIAEVLRLAWGVDGVGRGVDLNLELAPDLPRVDVDPTLVRQIIRNLAIHAAETQAQAGPGAVCVRTELIRADRTLLRTTCLGDDLPEGEYVMVEIADRGGSLSVERLDAMFDPLLRDKAKGRGFGLGLAAVIGVARAHRGSVKVETTPERGSVVQFFLPPVRV